MGAGGDIPRPLRLLLPLMLAGCIDFVEPDIAELGAPAVIDATIRLTDLGTVEIDARLEPGLDAAGLRRAVEAPIDLLDRTIESDTVLPGGGRRYVEEWLAESGVVGQRVRFRAPAVRGVSAARPEIEWPGITRAGPDTIDLVAGMDLRLPIAANSGAATPPPAIRQWFLNLSTDSASFTISATGPPPDTLYVPAEWIPDEDVTQVRLIFQQSAVLREPPGDYIGRLVLDVRLFWTLRRQRAMTKR